MIRFVERVTLGRGNDIKIGDLVMKLISITGQIYAPLLELVRRVFLKDLFKTYTLSI